MKRCINGNIEMMNQMTNLNTFLKVIRFYIKKKINAVFNIKHENKVYQTMFHKISVNT